MKMDFSFGGTTGAQRLGLDGSIKGRLKLILGALLAIQFILVLALARANICAAR